MIPKKAIEILIDLLGEGTRFPPWDRREAMRLGIESLRREQVQVRTDVTQPNVSLPDETEG